MNLNLFASFSILLLSGVCVAQVVDPEPGRLTSDGPYFIDAGDKVRTVSVDTLGNMIDTLGTIPRTFEVVSSDGQFRFAVRRRKVRRDDWKLPRTGRTFILSDPHGRMDALVSILKAGGVIDDNLKWAFGDDRVVIIGDVMDRGDDVTQIYWLLYELQTEAAPEAFS